MAALAESAGAVRADAPYPVHLEEQAVTTYVNYYRHDDCPLANEPVEWVDMWSCMCNDRCPRCDAEIEPYHSKVVPTGDDNEDLE